MKKLRFGILGLPANELALVKAYFRLFAAHPEFSWEIAEGLPADAALIDAEQFNQMTINPFPLGMPLLQIHSGSHAEKQNNKIARPLRSDRLEEWLRRVAYELSSNKAELRELPTQQVDEASLLVQSGRVKLLRWPPSILLRKDAMRIRLASMLMKKALSFNEMERVTSWPASKCMEFVDSLKSFGLIQSQEFKPAVVEGRIATATNASQDSAKPTVGFFERFRRKLGL